MGMKGLSKLGGGMKGAAAAKPAAKEPGKMDGEHEGGKGALEVHDHGDGTAHTVIEGKQEEHPDHMHAVAHVAHHLMPEGSHFHAHNDGYAMKSHGIHETGEHKETQEHGSPEEMHGAMDEMMGAGEGGEQHEAAEAGAEEPSMLGGFRG